MASRIDSSSGICILIIYVQKNFRRNRGKWCITTKGVLKHAGNLGNQFAIVKSGLQKFAGSGCEQFRHVRLAKKPSPFVDGETTSEDERRSSFDLEQVHQLLI